MKKIQTDASLFVEFFGDYPSIRVLDFLVENDAFDYNKKEIARQSSVSWNTLESFWKKLEEKKLVLFTRKIGKASLYKLNMKNPAVQKLIELDKLLMKESFKEVPAEKEKAKALAKVPATQ